MKPAIFNTAMVRAILDGRKTQTRRVITDLVCIRNAYIFNEVCCDGRFEFIHIDDMEDFLMFNPPYKVGDIIYVRETFSEWIDYDTRSLSRVTYKASDEDCSGKWKPSIHMPKEYARLFLRVKDVRIERLNEISEEDAKAEGVEEIFFYEDPFYRDYRYSLKKLKVATVFPNAKKSFETLWESIYGNGSFDNRYVWVIEFERISKEEAING